MSKYTVVIGGKERTIDKDKFDGNVEAIFAKYPDARIKAINGETEGMLPISNYSKAIEKGYRMVEIGDVEPAIAPKATSDIPPVVDSSGVQQRDSVKDYKPEIIGGVDRSFNLVKEMNEPTDTEKREAERKRIEEQAAQAKKVADERNLNSKNEVIHADAQAFRENPLSFYSEIFGFNTLTPKQVEARRKYDLNRVTAERANDTFNMVEEAKKKGGATFVEGFGRGFWEKASKASTWDFGARDLQSNLAVSAAAKKYSEGVPLSTEEETILDAVALEAAARGEFSGDLGRGYKAGETTAESIPFMAEFMINPATGTGKAVGKAAAKKLITNFGKEAAKSTIGKIARGAARIAGDVAGAGIMAGTTGAMRTSADAADRMTGEVKPMVDADGYYRFGGMEEGDSGMKAFAKAYGASTIENFSEMFGNYLAPARAAVGEFAGRSMKRIGLGKVNDIIGRVRSSDIAKIVDDFQGRTQWNGTIGEYLEEQAGMAMNALTVGDNKLSDLVDLDTQIDTFLGVSAFGGLFSGIKTGGYAREKYMQRKRMNEADREASGAIGEDWQSLKNQIDGADDTELVSILTDTMSDESLGDKQKQDVLLYAGRLKAYHGANLADLKRKTEGDTPDEVVQSQINFDAGYKLAEADRKEKRQAAKELDEVERKLDDEFLSSDESTQYDLMRQRASAGEDVNDELAYINVRSRFDGMIHGIRDVIDEKVGISNQYISRVTHQDGNVYDVTLSGDANKHMFPVSGAIVVDENGIVDRKHSDSRFIVRDESGKVGMRSVDDLYKVESMDNAEVLKEVSAQSIREQESARYAEEIDTPSDEEKAGEVAALQSGSEVTLNIGGVACEAVVQNVYSDGGIELRFEDKIAGHDGKEKSVDVFTAEEVATLLVPKEEISAVGGNMNNGTENEVKGIENTGDIQTGGKELDIAPAAVETGALSEAELVPDAVVELEDAGNSVPVDEKGNLLYHRAPVGVTLDDVGSYGLDEAEMDEFVSAQKANASKRLEKLQKGKPKVGTNLAKYRSEKKAWEDSLADAQAQVDYWDEVDAQVRAMRVQPGDVTAEAITSMGEPMNGEEFAAMMLGTGKLPLLFDDYKRETGFGNQDAKGMFGLFSAKANGGMSIEQAGEKLMDMDAANGTVFFDQTNANAGRNAVIDVLSSSRTRGDLFGYIKRNRERMAGQEREAEYSAYEQWVNDVAHMSVGDYEVDMETMDDWAKKYSESFNFDEINGNIADDLIIGENDRRAEGQGDEFIAGGNAEDIQGEFNEGAESGSVGQSEVSGSAGESQKGGEGGAVETDVSGGDVVGEQQPRGRIDENFAQRIDDAQITAEEKVKNDLLSTESSVSLQEDNQKENSNEIPESVSQGKHGTLLEEDRGSEEPSRRLRRRIEEASGDAPKGEGSRSGHQEVNRTIEAQAKEDGLWTPIQNTARLGTPFLSGNENDTYLDREKGVVYKVNNLMNSKDLISLFRRIDFYNEYFHQTKYDFVGVTGFGNGSAVYPIYKQEFVDNAEFASTGEIDAYMQSLGFKQAGEAAYSNGDVIISDLRPRNVLKDQDGDIYVVDADFKKQHVSITRAREEKENLFDYAERVVKSKELYDEQAKVNTEPSDAQKEAGNYKMGHVKIGGHEVTIENPKGSVRRGVDADGKAWETAMNNTYGYFRGTKGKDGDHVDVFLGENLKPERVYVVDQVNEDSSFDEHKVMYGFDSVEDAREAYLSNYEDGWQGIGAITGVPREVFDKWLGSGTKKQKPFAEYKTVQEKAFEKEAVNQDISSAVEEANTVSPDESPTEDSVIESKNLFDSVERIVEKEKINRDYYKALDAVNEFSEKCAGACKTLVIKSKEMLRRQLEAIHIDSEDIDKYERWFDEKKTIAFHVLRYERIIILDTNYSSADLNSYLWHENVHAALSNLSNRDDIINSIIPLVKKHANYVIERVDNGYSNEPDYIKREEYVTHFFEELIENGREYLMLSGDVKLKDIEANNAIKEILNYINNGREKDNAGSRSDIPRRRAGDDGGSKIKFYGKMRNTKRDVGHNAEGGRVWNDLRSILEAGEERLRRKDEGESSDSGIDSQSFQESEDVAKLEYENALDKAKNKMFRWQEAYQDSMLGLKKMQEAIEKESGEKLLYFEDAYMAENQMSSRSGYETDVYKDKFFIPMMDAVRALVKHGEKQKDVSRYVMAKHGLERNVVFAKRDAERDANEEFEQEYSDVKSAIDKGDIGHDEWEEIVNDIDARKKDFYEKEYADNRMKDYSGLKQLTGEEENFEATAMDLVETFESEHGELCGMLWEKINAATKRTLKKSYEGGLMTKSTYDKVRGMFEYYVPLRGWDDKVASDVYEYVLSEKSVFQAPVKTAFGRESLADDPFANIGNMAESGILQGNRNLMKQKFLNMVLNHPTSLATVKTMWYENVGSSEKPIWEQSLPDIKADATADEIAQAIEDHETRMAELVKNGMAKRSTKGVSLDYRASKREINEHIVVVKSGGREYVIFVNGNPRAAQAINGLTNPDATDHKFMQTVGKINRQLAANFTTRNPSFVLSNMSRDVIFSTSAIWVKEDWKYAKRFDRNITKNIGGIVGLMARYKSGKLDIRNQRDRYFLEFLENGGETGYTALHNVDEYKKMMNRYVRKSDGALGSVNYGMHAIVDAVGFMNRCAENVSRFTTYQTSREMGRGIAVSVRDAKEVTVNFNKKGAGGLGAGTFKSLFLFFNAAVQSLSNFKGLHNKSKSKFYTTLGGFAAAGILLPMLNNFIIESLVGDGDDDMTDEEREAWKRKRDAYDNLPEWVRKNNFCLWVGGEHFITIPLSIELRAFYGLGEMLYQMGRGNRNGVDGKLDVERVSLEMVNQLTELLPINPLGGNGDAVSVVIPDAGKPFYQVFTNKDFFGKPIYKKNDYNESMPAWTKAFSGTAKWMVNSAEFINEVSGGDKYKSGGVDLNPATIEHVFEGYFGGMGKTANQLFKTLSMIWDEDERMWRHVPVANRFFTGGDNKISFRKVNEAYYQYMEEYKETKQRMRGYENEAEMGIEEYAEKYDFLSNSKQHERYEAMKGYKKVVDELYRAIKESDPEEKKEIEMEINLLKMEIIEEIGLIK